MLKTERQTPTGGQGGPLKDLSEFSLVNGGALYRLWRRTRLSGDALEFTGRRVVVAILIMWVPLLLLSIAEGHAWGSSVALPFLQDVETHLRLLIAAPLLLLAEFKVHRQVSPYRAALRDKRPHRPRGAPAIRRRCRFGNAAAQFGRGGAAVDRVRVRGRHSVRVARSGGARREQLVRHCGEWATESVARRLVGRARQHAHISISVPALVFQVLHLGTLPLAGVAHEFAAGTGASGRYGRTQFSRPGTSTPIGQSCWRLEPCSPE